MPRQQVIVSRFGVPIPGQNEAALQASPPSDQYKELGDRRSAIDYILDLEFEPDERFHIIRTSSRKDHS